MAKPDYSDSLPETRPAEAAQRRTARRNLRLRRVGLLLAIGLIVLGGVYTLFSWQNQKARDRVDAALGSPQGKGSIAAQPPVPGSRRSPVLLDQSELDRSLDSEMEYESEQDMPDILRHFPSLSRGIHSVFSGMDNGVNVQETSDAYVLRVPLASQKDAGEVNLQVSSHHIQISGRTGSAPHEPGVSVMSTFMQSFDTSQALLPDKVRRNVQEKSGRYELVITVPKASPNADRSANGSSIPERQQSRDGFFTVPPSGSSRSGQAPEGFSLPPSHAGQEEELPLGEGTGVF